jgi:hypothetical protein
MRKKKHKLEGVKGKGMGMKKKKIEGVKRMGIMGMMGMMGMSHNDDETKNPIKYTRSLGTNVIISVSTETTTTLQVATDAPSTDAAEFTTFLAFILYTTDSGSITCTDSLSRTWTSLLSLPLNNTDFQVALFYLTGEQTIPTSTIITVTHPACERRVIMGDEFRNLLNPSPLDLSTYAVNSSPSTFISSGLTDTISENQELLYGVIGVNGPVTDSFTRQPSWTILHDRGTSVGDGYDLRLLTLFRTTELQGEFEVSGSLSTARLWGAGIETFKSSGGGATQDPDY